MPPSLKLASWSMNRKGESQAMKRMTILIITVSLLFAVSDAWSRDSVQEFSIVDVVENPEYSSRLAGVSFYFAGQDHPPIKTNHGEFQTNKKTNAFGKSDQKACQWVMLSALLQMHKRAQSLGADAVVDIKSNYKNREVSSATHYTCGAGATVAGVALIGTVVELE
jgi:hypothetical protein